MTTEELAAMPLRERITGSLINLIPPVILIVGVLGSIFTGWATPTEAAGVGALFSLILAIFYKQFSWKMLYDSLIDTAKTSAWYLSSCSARLPSPASSCRSTATS